MAAGNRTPRASSRFGRIALRVIIPVIFAGALWHLFTNVARFGTVVSDSMNPSLQIGDYYVLRLDAYGGDRVPEQGDIVVFDRPGEGTFIKRVIGHGGDLIGIDHGRVWLNGAWLDEPYLKERAVTELPLATKVPDGHVFVLGDNRNKSGDSRDYGPIPVGNVMGKVTKIMWPLGRAKGFGPIEYE